MSTELSQINDVDIRVGTQGAQAVVAFRSIPYSLISAEIKDGANGMLAELTEIARFYKIYKEGAIYTVEGTNGDYIPATLKSKMAATLVNKQARFLFAEAPDMKVEHKGDVGKVTDSAKDALTILNDLVKTVLDANKFEEQLIKAAKDCFIGKRVAGLVNFNEDDGVTITFLPSTQFLYETSAGNPNIITKFVAFISLDSGMSSKARIMRKRYTLEDDVVWLEETMYDSAGALIEEITEKQETLMPMIPVSVFVNDGLTGDSLGESEIDATMYFEEWYSKLNSADIDAQRKSMNPIRYTVDMDNKSTQNLKSSAGSYWDLQSDQNLENRKPNVGVLESSMQYSDSLGAVLDRIKTMGFEQVDMPNITLESMQGAITSGKSLKAIYWPLDVRCKEKMKMWGPQLGNIIRIIVEGAKVYPECITRYTESVLLPVAYEVLVVPNHPLPEDEAEEKNMDLEEVAAHTMSRRTYMQKWRNLTDDEVDAELQQMAKERTIIEDSTFAQQSDGAVHVD